MDSPSPSPEPSVKSKESEGLLAGTPERTIYMERDKITKNTVRYSTPSSDGSAPPIKTVYVEKWALGATSPPAISLTLKLLSSTVKK
jgi:hypothetical protein